MQNLYAAVIGEKNTVYYLEKFQRFDQQASGLKASWNWSAFLFSGLWLLYRKIYLWFFVYWLLGATLVGLVIFNAADSSKAFDIIVYITLAFHIICGIYGNFIYYKQVNKKIEAAKLTLNDNELLEQTLSSKGGTSVGQTASFLSVFTLCVGLIAGAIVIAVGGMILFMLLGFFNVVFCHGGCFPS